MRERMNMRTVVNAAALVILTAAVSVIATIVVLENTGHDLTGKGAGTDFAGVYEIERGVRLSLLPGKDDVDGGRAPFYIYEMSDDPDDDSLKVTGTGLSERRGAGCLVLYDDRGEPIASVICSGDIYYLQKTGKKDCLPKEIRVIDDEAVVPE